MFKKKIFMLLATLTMVVFINIELMAQLPPPPPEHGGSGNTPGGNAPIGGGLGILLVLGAAFGGRKIYYTIKNQEELEE